MTSVILVNIGRGNGLSPVRHQAITWTNADLFLFGPLETNTGEVMLGVFGAVPAPPIRYDRVFACVRVN